MKDFIPTRISGSILPLLLLLALSLSNCASTGTNTSVVKQNNSNENSDAETTLSTTTQKKDLKDVKSVYDVPPEKHFKYLKYLLSRKEKRQFKSLDKNAKFQYLQNFWQDRDPSPSTPENEFLRSYYSRIYLANRSLDEPFNEGWNTDRGRVLILYGYPDDIQRTQNSRNSHPYETWQYYHLNKENNVEFVFVDKHSSGHFDLVHSSLRKELTDPNWTRWLDGMENPF